MPNVSIYKLAIGMVCSLVGIFFWEHLGRLYKYERPSIYLLILVDKSITFFRNVGRMFAWLSSYLTWIKLEEIYITARDLIIPIVNLLLSPLQIIYGYWIATLSYMDKAWLIYIGSGLLVGAVAIICYANRITILNLSPAKKLIYIIGPVVIKVKYIVDKLMQDINTYSRVRSEEMRMRRENK
jgi:hypothetical protein